MGIRKGLLACVALGASGPAFAQVIQLPSVHTFGVETTVVVPDRGTVSIAGDERAAADSDSFNAMPRSRGIDMLRQASAARVNAHIHDSREADRSLLSEARAQRHKPARSETAIDRTPFRRPNDLALPSLAEIGRQREHWGSVQEREVLTLVAKARAARAAGKPAVAHIYYRSAARQARGSMRQRIEAETIRPEEGTRRGTE